MPTSLAQPTEAASTQATSLAQMLRPHVGWLMWFALMLSPLICTVLDIVTERIYNVELPNVVFQLLVLVIPAFGSVLLGTLSRRAPVAARWAWALAWLVVIPLLFLAMALLLLGFTGIPAQD